MVGEWDYLLLVFSTWVNINERIVSMGISRSCPAGCPKASSANWFGAQTASKLGVDQAKVWKSRAHCTLSYPVLVNTPARSKPANHQDRQTLVSSKAGATHCCRCTNLLLISQLFGYLSPDFSSWLARGGSSANQPSGLWVPWSEWIPRQTLAMGTTCTLFFFALLYIYI